MPRQKGGRKVVANNRKAQHEYALEDPLEAGMVLIGSEIKSIRAGRVQLADGYVEVRGGEMWLLNVHIDEYKEASRFGHDARRPRKLLLHRKEIARLSDRVREKGYTIIPTLLYLKDGRAKVEIAVARGKKQYDKRDDVAKREVDRTLRRVVKEQRYDD
jgi:SsrA-binding protein